MRAVRRLYGRIIDATGWTYPQVDALSMPQAIDLVANWNESPPFVECVRLYLGIKPPVDEPEVIDVGPRTLTEEQWKRIRDAEEKFAEVSFRRNPLA